MHNSKLWQAASLLILILAIGLQGSYIIGPTTSPITPSTGIPKFVQTAEAHQTTIGTLSASFGSLPQINNAVFVAATATGGSPVDQNLELKITDNQGNAYVKVASYQFTADPEVSLWCSIALTSSGTYTVTADSNSLTAKGIMLLEYSATTCNPDKTTFAQSAASPYSCGSFTTQNTNNLLLTVLGVGSGGTGTITFTAPTGFAIKNSFGVVASGNPMAVADEVVSTAGTFTPTFGASQNRATTQCVFAAMISH